MTSFIFWGKCRDARKRTKCFEKGEEKKNRHLWSPYILLLSLCVPLLFTKLCQEKKILPESLSKRTKNSPLNWAKSARIKEISILECDVFLLPRRAWFGLSARLAWRAWWRGCWPSSWPPPWWPWWRTRRTPRRRSASPRSSTRSPRDTSYSSSSCSSSSRSSYWSCCTGTSPGTWWDEQIRIGDVKFSGRLKISWSTNLPYCSQLID